MSQMNVVSLTLLRVHSSGIPGTRAALAGKLIQLAGMGFQPEVDGRVVVFEPDRATSREVTLPWIDVEAWPLEDLCARPVDVKDGDTDTAEVWSDVTLHIDWNGRRKLIHLRLGPSGRFEGQDARFLERALDAIEEAVDKARRVWPPGPERHEAIYGFGGDIDALANKLTTALGQPLFERNNTMGGRFYHSMDGQGRSEALALVRRIENRPILVLDLSPPGRLLLSVTALPKQVDVVDAQLVAAGLDFKRIERGSVVHPRSPKFVSRPPRPEELGALDSAGRLGAKDRPRAAGPTRQSQAAPTPVVASDGPPVAARFAAVAPKCWRVVDEVRRVALGLLAETRGFPPMCFRMEGGRTARSYTSDLSRVHGVRDVRREASGRVDSAVAFIWDRDPDGTRGAIAIELRLQGMEAPIRYLQRYRLADEAQAASELGPPIVAGKCTWGRHGEDEPSFPPLRCPVCAAEMVDDTPRYPYRVCGTCVGMAQSADGRPLRFGSQGMGGFIATFADTGEIHSGHECFIAGVRCEANEAHLGGIVVEAGPAWLVYRDADGMHSILLRGPNVLTIGRDPKCDIAVKDFGLSSRHAWIRVTADGGLTLTDLNSKGGSQVNGHGVVEAPTSAGDMLRLGTVDFAIVAAPLRIDSERATSPR
jgi:hypothetical protein